MKLSIYKLIFIFGIFITAFPSCSDSDSGINPGIGLQFIGEVSDGISINTRAPVDTLIQQKDFPGVFYLMKSVNGEKKCSTYLIPEQRNGVFRSYATYDSLKWESRNDPHIFYGWNMPWLGEYERDPYLENFEDGTKISFNQDDEMYAAVANNLNCSILETFVGAKNGPVTFLNNGEYVNLKFTHLVSKIRFDRLRLTYTTSDGIRNYDIRGTMIFYGLPSEGVFIREGENGPVVKANPLASDEVSYQVYRDLVIYVCPDVDFSKVSFRIVDHSAPDKGDFLGDFSNINLVRDPADWWDAAHSDPHVLYAGELMGLNITLRQGRGTIVSADINGWNTQTVREGTVYGKQGFYDVSGLRYVYDALNNNYSEEAQDEMFELYGDQESGEYRLYGDLDGVSHGIRLGTKYVLNGMGYTINISPYSNNVIRISRVKDVYLSDGKGHTVYVDENFNVYVVNEDGSLRQPSTGRLDDLNDGMYGYNINLETGAVNQTNLF